MYQLRAVVSLQLLHSAYGKLFDGNLKAFFADYAAYLYKAMKMIWECNAKKGTLTKIDLVEDMNAKGIKKVKIMILFSALKTQLLKLQMIFTGLKVVFFYFAYMFNGVIYEFVIITPLRYIVYACNLKQRSLSSKVNVEGTILPNNVQCSNYLMNIR